MADAQPPLPSQDHLAAYLAQRDVPCPACNYNLRGLTADRCPECNRELVLQIRLAEPRIGAWIAALSAAAAMLGFNGLLLLYFLAYMARGRQYGPPWPSVATLLVSTVIAGIGLSQLIKRRRAFGNLSAGARGTWAAGAWLATAASAIAFFSFVDN